MDGPLRWMKCGAVAAMLVAAVGRAAEAQYFNPSSGRSYTPGTLASPLQNLLCSGLAAEPFADTDSQGAAPQFVGCCPMPTSLEAPTGVQVAVILCALLQPRSYESLALIKRPVPYFDVVSLPIRGPAPEGPGPDPRIPVPVPVPYAVPPDRLVSRAGRTIDQVTVTSGFDGGKAGDSIRASARHSAMEAPVVVPEPSPDLLFASGLAVLALGYQLRRRRRRDEGAADPTR